MNHKANQDPTTQTVQLTILGVGGFIGSHNRAPAYPGLLRGLMTPLDYVVLDVRRASAGL